MTAKQYSAIAMTSHGDEDSLQRAVCDYLDIYVRLGTLIYWSTPNELPRPSLLMKLIGKEMVDKIYSMIGAVLNARGRKAGAPDIVVQIANGPALYFELKRGKGTLTAAQRGFRNWFMANGCYWYEIRTLDAAMAAIAPYVRRVHQ